MRDLKRREAQPRSRLTAGFMGLLAFMPNATPVIDEHTELNRAAFFGQTLEQNMDPGDIVYHEQFNAGVLQGELPETYSQAIDGLQSIPFIERAVKNGYISGVTVSLAPSRDFESNALFDVEQQHIHYLINPWILPGRFQTYGDLQSMGIHEAAHGVTLELLKPVYRGFITDDEELTGRIEHLRDLCTEVRFHQYDRFFVDVNEWYSAQLTDSAGSIRSIAGELESDSRLQVEMLADMHDNFSAMMMSGAITQRLVTLYGTSSCISPGVTEAMNTLLLIDNFSRVSIDEQTQVQINDASRDLFDMDTSLEESLDELHRCFSEDAARMAAEGVERKDIEAGWPWSSLSEHMASTITTLIVHPEYIPECLSTLDGETADLHARYALAHLDLLKYRAPDMFAAILESNPGAAQAIADMRLFIFQG
ncbi:MAG: hypothetical protein AAF413_02360 [Patescibacteria group bacterium]